MSVLLSFKQISLPVIPHSQTRQGEEKSSGGSEAYLVPLKEEGQGRAMREGERKDNVLLSLVLAMKRLPPKRLYWLKFKMQGLVCVAEFRPAYSQHQQHHTPGLYLPLIYLVFGTVTTKVWLPAEAFQCEQSRPLEKSANGRFNTSKYPLYSC